jgi:hypothetical protein
MITQLAAQAIAQTLWDARETGATVTLGAAEPTTGYVVGIPGYVLVDAQSADIVAQWVQQTPEATGFGVWRDQRTGRTYFDAVDVIQDRTLALMVAAVRDELAIWDLDAGEELRVTTA